MKWMVVLTFLGAVFNASAVLIAAESFQTSAETDDYTADLHVAATANSKIVVGNVGFNTAEPWVNPTGAITANGTGLTHSGVVALAEQSSLGALRVQPAVSGGIALDRNSRRNLGTLPPPLASTYYLSGLVKLGELNDLRGGQDLSVGFEYTVAANVYSVSNGMHFGVRREADDGLGGAAYLTASAAGASWDLLDLTGHYGETFQIVLRLDVSATGNETLNVWYAVDGATTLTLGLDAVNIETWDDEWDLKMLIAQGKSTYNFNPFGARFDEIRLGTEFADVTTLPEPGLSGRYEAWIGNYPSAGALTNRTDNPDGDALNNLYEWGLGGDPTNGTDIGHVPTYGIGNNGGTNVLEYVYPKRNNADILGLTYHLEQNTDLITGTWTNDNYLVGGTGTLDGEFNSVTNTVPTTTEDVQFLKLIIQDN